MKTGLFGGAFNPIHNGHLAVAKAAIDAVSLDRLIFIPTGNAPHKKTQTPGIYRFNMVKLAIAGEEKMFVSDYEISSSKVSYSADTVEYFKSLYPCDELFFIIGDDSYNMLDTWHEPQRIFRSSTLLVFPREGADVKPPAVKIYMPTVKISSSDIREKIKLGKDCRKLLPKSVFDYIIKGNLYGSDNL